jgi:hypothetical protein
MANQVMMQHLYWRKLTLNPAVLFRWNPLNTCPKDLLGLPPGGGCEIQSKGPDRRTTVTRRYLEIWHGNPESNIDIIHKEGLKQGIKRFPRIRIAIRRQIWFIFINFQSFPWKEKTKQGGCKKIQNKNEIKVNRKAK